jgi:hypothetical protein
MPAGILLPISNRVQLKDPAASGLLGLGSILAHGWCRPTARQIETAPLRFLLNAEAFGP